VDFVGLKCIIITFRIVKFFAAVRRTVKDYDENANTSSPHVERVSRNGSSAVSSPALRRPASR